MLGMRASKKTANRRSETRVIVAAVFCCGTRRLPTKLQLDRFELSDELLVVFGKEPVDHVEHGVTDTNNVEDVRACTMLYPS
jgi:hypothetical protein